VRWLHGGAVDKKVGPCNVLQVNHNVQQPECIATTPRAAERGAFTRMQFSNATEKSKHHGETRGGDSAEVGAGGLVWKCGQQSRVRGPSRDALSAASCAP
jgi:hypothetical protein